MICGWPGETIGDCIVLEDEDIASMLVTWTVQFNFMGRI
jgi:hypothetical protein